MALALAVTLTRSPNSSPNPDQEPFARRRPELTVSSVKVMNILSDIDPTPTPALTPTPTPTPTPNQVMNILSDASKEKNIDTAKAYLGVGEPAVRIEVDFVPTI